MKSAFDEGFYHASNCLEATCFHLPEMEYHEYMRGYNLAIKLRNF